MKYIQGQNRSQTYLFPVTLNDTISEDGNTGSIDHLVQNENYKINFRITRHLPGQPESARSSQVVGFFQFPL